MNDGTQKRIEDIVVGDVLLDNNSVTGKFRLETAGSDIYNLNGIIVSNSHIVFCSVTKKWIPVSEHFQAVRIHNYTKPYLYCLNTTEKVIVVNNMVFTDWDEVYDESLVQLKAKYGIEQNADIHKRLDDGFNKYTIVQLLDGTNKQIHSIDIGDILEGGERVYGVVEISNSRYHLLTDVETFTIDQTKYYDYNAFIDK
jgi:hypothetical protein